MPDHGSLPSSAHATLPVFMIPDGPRRGGWLDAMRGFSVILALALAFTLAGAGAAQAGPEGSVRAAPGEPRECGGPRALRTAARGGEDRQHAYASRGMVVSEDPVASEVGIE